MVVKKPPLQLSSIKKNCDNSEHTRSRNGLTRLKICHQQGETNIRRITMSNKMMNTIVTTALIACLGFASASAMAGRDAYQEKLIQNTQVTKQKLEQAKSSKGAEQQKLLSEHSQMLHDNMAACRDMKPKAGMTEKERDEWFAEHQKIMDVLMAQMMEEHKVKSSMPCDHKM